MNGEHPGVDLNKYPIDNTANLDPNPVNSELGITRAFAIRTAISALAIGVCVGAASYIGVSRAAENTGEDLKRSLEEKGDELAEDMRAEGDNIRGPLEEAKDKAASLESQLVELQELLRAIGNEKPAEPTDPPIELEEALPEETTTSTAQNSE